MASSFSFCLTDQCDLSTFLFNNSSIFHLKGDPSLSKFDVFENFFELVKNTQSLAELALINIDDGPLREFEADNNVGRKQYQLKTKLRSLFVAVLVQRRLHFLTREGLNFYSEASKELFDALPTLRFEQDEEVSLVSFYIVLREIKAWKTHSKWEKFAMYAASIAVGEGVWYCPGGGAKPVTMRRMSIFKLISSELASRPKTQVSSKRRVGSKTLSTLSGRKKRSSSESDIDEEIDFINSKRAHHEFEEAATSSPSTTTTKDSDSDSEDGSEFDFSHCRSGDNHEMEEMVLDLGCFDSDNMIF